MAIRDSILKADDRKRREVELGEWGAVTFRALSGRQLEHWHKKVKESDDGFSVEHAALLLVFSVIDPESGELAFSEDDVAALADKNAKLLMEAADCILELNGLKKEEMGDANPFATTPGSGSGSA